MKHKLCIFCKESSSGSKSYEHIIPETLGNTDHVLPPGIVCDKCNNYFARKIEKPLLETEYFVQLRSRQQIKNKKGTIKSIQQRALIPSIGMSADVLIDKNQITINGENDRETEEIYSRIARRKTGSLWMPLPTKPEPYLMARFLGKVALEVMVHRVIDVPGWEIDVIHKSELDELRSYVRRGSHSRTIWPFSERKLHQESQMHQEHNEVFQVLHEFTLLYTDKRELFLVISIFGDEFAINLGGPEIDGYLDWLSANDHKSPLYMSEKTWPQPFLFQKK